MMDLNNPVDPLQHALHFIYLALQRDKRLRSAHVALYYSLIIVRHKSQACSEFIITRKELVQLSRIGSIATYQKCIYELVHYGYIEYKPTFNSYIGTKVRFIF